ncbi:Epsin-2 [Entamoeba marina]
MSGFFASARKTLYGLTDAQDFLREATNNEQWGPTSKQQQKIIQYTFHYKECREVMDYLYKRLYEDGKHWREIYKSLLVLDNILKNGSDEAVNIAVSRVVDVKTLQINVRERSKQILELLTDSDYLKQVRDDSKNQKKDYGGVGSDTGYGYNSYRSSRYEDSNYSNTTSSYSRETKAESPVKEIDIQSTNDTRYVEQDASPPKAADLLSFDSQHKEPIKKNTSTSLFDMLSEPQVQQQTQQVQQKQTKQPDLFDFLANITVDSIEDKRKQPRTSSQHKQTLGQLL